jgi:Ser/Thr protein kinase RdoA (MazF antagonist)
MAFTALEQYDLNIGRVRLVTNDMNGIFRVDTVDGQKYILKVTDPSGCHGLEEVRSEMMWLAALRRDTTLGVPQPLTTREGQLATTVEVSGVPEPRHCIIFTWVPGADLADRLTPENMRRFGAFAALLHEHAKTFQPPDGFRVRTLAKIFYYANPDFPFVEPFVLFDEAHRDLFPADRLEIYRRAVDLIQDAHNRLYVDPRGLRVVHNDLHPWNVKVYRGKVYALDFEDLAWGYPVQDIATTFYYLQGEEQEDELCAAFREGYTRHSEWPEQYPGQIETFIASRALMLTNYVVCSEDPTYKAIAPDYVARAERRLQELLNRN